MAVDVKDYFERIYQTRDDSDDDSDSDQLSTPWSEILYDSGGQV